MSPVGRLSTIDRGVRPRLKSKPPQNIDQLDVRGGGRIAKFVHRVSVGQFAQTDEFVDLLPPVQLERGRPVGEQNATQFAVTEQTIELVRRHVDEEKDKNPQLDRNK